MGDTFKEKVIYLCLKIIILCFLHLFYFTSLPISILLLLLLLFLFRTVFSSRTFLTQPSMFTGLVPSESTDVHLVANAGILLSTVLNVQLPCQLTVLCTCGRETIKIFTASGILKGTVTTSIKGRCAWDSGLGIVLIVLRLTHTQAGTQCPGSLLKKFPSLRTRFRYKAVQVFGCLW